jgi:SAM-dependent methyltransferase
MTGVRAGSLQDVTTERRFAFGAVADLYDLARPSYPLALVDDVLAFAGAERGDPAVEVGAGTGKATELFAERGLRIVALEPSFEMARIAQHKLAAYDVTIEQTEFEQWAPHERFRLVFSAQAWHWVNPDLRYTRAREALADGGALAIFWNRPRWETSPVRDELSDAYGRAAPELGSGGTGPGPMDPDVHSAPEWWGDWTKELRATPGFEAPEARSYPWTQVYTTAEYVQLLQTHSDHIVLPNREREALLEAVAGVIDRSGGSLTLEYVTGLWLARTAGAGGASG